MAKGIDKIAVCPRDGAPLISTFVFDGAEYYCVECGYAFGMFEQERVEWTQELQDKHDALLAEVAPLLAQVVVRGSRLDNCTRCNTAGLGDHSEHATDAQRAASNTALETLVARARAGA